MGAAKDETAISLVYLVERIADYPFFWSFTLISVGLFFFLDGLISFHYDTKLFGHSAIWMGVERRADSTINNARL